MGVRDARQPCFSHLSGFQHLGEQLGTWKRKPQDSRGGRGSASQAANATVSAGSVTNVAFFANGTPLASDQIPPFSITTGGLGAGDYSLTAVATAAGISATSAVVNITVVCPLTNPGLSYLIQNSPDLINWVPVVTNVASSNPVLFTDGFISSGSRYYRVGRLPNP
jgi:hypothetical protein